MSTPTARISARNLDLTALLLLVDQLAVPGQAATTSSNTYMVVFGFDQRHRFISPTTSVHAHHVRTSLHTSVCTSTQTDNIMNSSLPPGAIKGLSTSSLLPQRSKDKVKTLLANPCDTDISASRTIWVRANINLLMEAFVHFSQFRGERLFWDRLYSALEVKNGAPSTLRDAFVWYCDSRRAAVSKAARKKRPVASCQISRLIDKAIEIEQNTIQNSPLPKAIFDAMWRNQEQAWSMEMTGIISAWADKGEKKALPAARREARRATNRLSNPINQGSGDSNHTYGNDTSLRSGVKIVSGEAVEPSSEEEDTQYEFSVNLRGDPNSYLDARYPRLLPALAATAQPVVGGGHRDHGPGVAHSHSYPPLFEDGHKQPYVNYELNGASSSIGVAQEGHETPSSSGDDSSNSSGGQSALSHSFQKAKTNKKPIASDISIGMTDIGDHTSHTPSSERGEIAIAETTSDLSAGQGVPQPHKLLQDQNSSCGISTSPQGSGMEVTCTTPPGPLSHQSPMRLDSEQQTMTSAIEEIQDDQSNYQTKEEASLIASKQDERFIQLECNLQRIDAVEDQIRDLQFRRALEGRVSSSPELKKFFEVVDGEIERIRLKIKASIRHQDVTDDGWKKMLLLGDVLWALDSAAENAKKAARSL